MRSLLALFLLAVPVFSQEFRSTLSGAITDPTGAAVPNAKVLATEERTGTKLQTVSDAAGQYVLPFLAPGEYSISVQFAGFKEFIRKSVHVGSGDHPVIDVALEVGNASQSVEVTEDVTLLNSENASVGQAITTREVEDLPLNGRTPLVLASLSMGVLATGQPALIHPFDSAAAAGWSIGGSPSQTNEILIDGSPDATWDGRLAYSPPTDAVQEVRVKAFDSDAAFGHTSGGTLNQVLKTGTNSLHGSAWEFNQPNTLIANSFFNNKAGLGNPVTHYNQYGITAGGPIFVPKVFNGKNKLFWFFAWEGVKDSQPNTTFLTVPTDAERKGDFSALLALGSQYQLYDPFSAKQSGTTITRTPIANNIIQQVNPVAAAYMKFFPEPNIVGQAGGFGNFGSTAGTPDNYNNELGRLDYNLSERDRLFFDIRRTDYSQTKNNYFNNASTGSILTRANWGGSLDNVFTVNATNFVDVRLNFTRMDEAHPAASAGFDPTSLGFPGYMATSSQYPQLPLVTFAGATSPTTVALGFNAANKLPSQSLQLFGTWVTVRRNHTIKIGADGRQYVLNAASYGNSAGSFSFTANSWVRASSSASSAVVLGQDFAEFVMGLPTSGSYDINTSASYYEHYGAVFVQDDWRLRKNLTVNLGLRFDYDAPYHEKYNRTIDGFDMTSQNPLAPAANAAYNAHPISQIPVGSFNALGGVTYPTDGAVYQQNSHMLSPRVGFAWTPGILHNKTVIRGGFAIFVQPLSITQLDISGKYSTNPIQNQYGFSQTTTYIASNDNFLTPATTLSNPFPGGIKQPVGSSLGLATFAGQTVQFIDPQVSDPYSVRWNFGFEHAITPNTMLEVTYMGNHGVHLPVYVTQFNGIPAQYLSTLGTRDQANISALTATVPNPFAGLNTSQNGTSTTVAQLLARFPEFPVGTGSGSTGVIEQNNSIGSSSYQSLNVRIQKRFSDGMTLVGNYINSKLIERITFLNDVDSQLEKRISPFDHPNRFVVGIVYELPFGKGKHFNVDSRWVDLLVGGWGVNSIYTYQTGAPLTWVNGSTTSPGDYVYFGAPIVLDNRATNVPAFNVSAFDTKSADQFQYHMRTFSTTFPNLRSDGINEWSPSVTKRLRINEGMSFQLRAEAYNVLNHPTFSAPSTTVTSPTTATSGFGVISAQANRSRILQIGARFVF
ncbi:MAG TPA: carboxypeptidase-like regulatory domain-containing protein [Bryobacteraceae bacterium]|nr:carboxypeptidase-like regulatory domain-containing protein [Bryobacteraceae bacterium]